MIERRRVVIVGGGFGGVSAAQNLKSDLVDVTLIDRRNYHLFQPLLYQVATGSLSPGEISSQIRGVLSPAIQDLTFNRGARLITGVVPTDFNLNEELSSSRAAPALKRKAAPTALLKPDLERVHLEQRLGHG